MVIYAKFYNKQIRDENICLYIQLNKSWSILVTRFLGNELNVFANPFLKQQQEGGRIKNKEFWNNFFLRRTHAFINKIL